MKSIENIQKNPQKSPVKRTSTRLDDKPSGNKEENSLDITDDLSSEESCSDVKRQRNNDQ